MGDVANAIFPLNKNIYGEKHTNYKWITLAKCGSKMSILMGRKISRKCLSHINVDVLSFLSVTLKPQIFSMSKVLIK